MELIVSYFTCVLFGSNLGMIGGANILKAVVDIPVYTRDTEMHGGGGTELTGNKLTCVI